MAGTINIASNVNTMQDSLANQSVKCILASRAFIAPADEVGPGTKLNVGAGFNTSTAPGGNWTDLGAIMKSKVSMAYNKDYAEVRSGLDGVFRAAYVTSKTCEWNFALDNYDTTVLGLITGQPSSTINGGGAPLSVGYRFWIGSEDIVTKALLIVGTNKIDGKEHQYWAKQALLKFAWEEDGDAVVIRVTATLRAASMTMTDGTARNNFYQVTIFD